MKKLCCALILLILSISIHAVNSQIPGMKCSDYNSNICGPNAKCIDDRNNWKYTKYGGPFCECDSNFVGKPPNCKIGCENDLNCSLDEYCTESNDCVKGCRESGTCDFNEYCDVVTRQCNKGCKTHHNCKNNEYCSSEENECRKVCDDFTCGRNSVCVADHHSKYCKCADGYIPEGGKGCIKKEAAVVDEFDCENSCGEDSSCNASQSYCYCEEDLESNPFYVCLSSGDVGGLSGSAPKPGSEFSISLACVITICTG